MCLLESAGLTDEFWTASGVPELDDACGAGTSALDLNATDYLDIMSASVVRLGDNVGHIIPEAEIENVCQVCVCKCLCVHFFLTVLLAVGVCVSSRSAVKT